MWTLISIFAVSMLAGQTAGLSATPNDQLSPKDLLERYFRAEVTGAYLGVDGWYKASDFFIHLDAPPKKVAISVISHDYSVWKPQVSGDSARVIVETITIGDIDPSLRFTESETIKGFVGYDLILTSTYWERDPQGRIQEVTGQPKWKIKGTLGVRFLTADAATRYVIQARDSSSNPVIRRNADLTISRLKGVR